MLEHALFSSIVAFVYAGILVQPGELLDWVPIVAIKITSNKKLHKVMFACEKCVAGQLAFWTYLLNSDYNIFDHIYTTFLSIFITAFLIKLWQRI